MSIRVLLGVLLSAVFVLGFVFIVLSITFVEHQASSLFSLELALQTESAFRMLLVQQALGLFVVALILLLALFWSISSYIVMPLRTIIGAMRTFITRGTKVDVPDFSQAPTEVQTLAEVFTALEDRVERSHKNDMEISRVKSDFISTAAHQLRTPLTGIRWALEALEKEPLSEEQRALVKSATEKSHDLVAIVGTLLDISSIESGKYNYTFSSIDISALLVEVAKDLGILANTHQVSLFYAKGEFEVPHVYIDKERIKWVLNNLIENAVQYTPAGGSVRLSVEGRNDRVFVRIRDTGIGIPKADRGNIFERFYRGSNAVVKEGGGKGLGLYIARTIATDHNGDLSFVPNTDGPGTTFILTLPVAKI